MAEGLPGWGYRATSRTPPEHAPAQETEGAPSVPPYRQEFPKNGHQWHSTRSAHPRWPRKSLPPA
jgi:hypothetical protein